MDPPGCGLVNPHSSRQTARFLKRFTYHTANQYDTVVGSASQLSPKVTHSLFTFGYDRKGQAKQPHRFTYLPLPNTTKTERIQILL